MCMTQQKEAAIDKVEAWKVFSLRDGKLESPFMTARYVNAETDKPMNVIPYEVNQRIKVVPKARRSGCKSE